MTAAAKSLYAGTYLQPGNASNFPMVDDPVIMDYTAKLSSFELLGNPAEQDRLAKELGLHLMSQAYWIGPPSPYEYTIWQPWIKNFYGLYAMGRTNFYQQLKYAWIDQGLKTQMGY